MKKIICKKCGATDIVKENGRFICKQCGTQYSLDEMKMLIDKGTAADDKSALIECSRTEEKNPGHSQNEISTFQEEKDIRRYSEDEELIDNYIQKNKKKRTILIVTIVVIAVLAGLSVYNKIIVPSSKYTTAVEYLEEGNYSEAYEIFDELGDYKDSVQQKKTAIEYLQQEQLKKASVDDVVAFGRYYWIVLDREELSNGTVNLFMLAKDCVAEGNYNSVESKIAWEDSSVRKWLNSNFYNQFSERQKELITLSSIQNVSYKWRFSIWDYEMIDYGDTADYFFLLSTEEVGDYLFNSEYRSAMYDGDDVWWWLRTPGKSKNCISYIWSGGEINDYGLQPDAADLYTMGIRPAMNLCIPGEEKDDNDSSTTDSNDIQEKDGYINAYKDIISSLDEEINTDESLYSEYLLHDLDGDNVPEIIIHLGTCEADSEYRVYRFEDGRALLAGVFYGGDGYLVGLDKENSILLVTAHMGYQSIDRISLENGKIAQKNIFEEEVPPEEDYTNFVQLKMKTLENSNDMTWEGNVKSGNDALLDALL